MYQKENDVDFGLIESRWFKDFIKDECVFEYYEGASNSLSGKCTAAVIQATVELQNEAAGKSHLITTLKRLMYIKWYNHYRIERTFEIHRNTVQYGQSWNLDVLKNVLENHKDDNIEIGGAIEYGNNDYPEYLVLIVQLKRMETLDEFKTRLYETEIHIQALKEKRRKQYLKLKKEFESEGL